MLFFRHKNKKAFKQRLKILMGRMMGFEPTHDGTTTRCVNRFTTSAISVTQLELYSNNHDL